MAVTQLLEQLLRIQAAAGNARVMLAEQSGIPGVGQLARQIVQLETQLAQSIASGLGATPMAMGGLVTSPTFALLGEAGPEMVTPVKKKRRVSKYQRTLGKEIRIFDAKARLKNGNYRSGWNRSKVMRLSHKATRKILGMR